jgi:hypothetical protein
MTGPTDAERAEPSRAPASRAWHAPKLMTLGDLDSHTSATTSSRVASS